MLEESPYDAKLKCDALVEVLAEVDIWEVDVEPLKVVGKGCITICHLIPFILKVYVYIYICCAICNSRVILSSSHNKKHLLASSSKESLKASENSASSWSRTVSSFGVGARVQEQEKDRVGEHQASGGVAGLAD